MKLLNQKGISLKPIAIMLAILAGITYFILNDIKKKKFITANKNSTDSSNPSNNPSLNNPEKDPDSINGSKELPAPHEQVIIDLSNNLKKVGVCQSAFINRNGGPAKFFTSDDIPESEEIAKINIESQTVLEIGKVIEGYRVNDILLDTKSKTPLTSLGDAFVYESDLQVEWQSQESGDMILANPISMKLVVNSISQIIQDCQFSEVNTSDVATSLPVANIVNKDLSQVTIQSGSVCGVARYECGGSFVADNPVIASHPAKQIEAFPCNNQSFSIPQCVFTNQSSGFRLEGLNCADGYRAITHPGQLSENDSGTGPTTVTQVIQFLMVLCVKQ